MKTQLKHPYEGQVVYFGTKHSKEQAIQAVLSGLGMTCKSVPIDTDEFGTFSGEIERQGSVKDALRRKIQKTFEAVPGANLALASEGSFGPHPFIPLIQSDHEALMFVDRELNIEIYVDEISIGTNFTEIEFGPRDNLDSFLERANFPSHAVIVKPKSKSNVVFKGLGSFHAVGQAIIDAFMVSDEAKVILSTDMRACFNPTRMKAIEKLGEKLVKRLSAFCSQCNAIGFGAPKSIDGLPCEQCGLPTQRILALQYFCLKCNHSETVPREDGLLLSSAANCEFCNP